MKLSMISIKTLAALAVCVVAASAQAADPIKVRLGDLAQALNGIASNVMIQQGFDKKNGIAVEYTTYPTLDGLFTASCFVDCPALILERQLDSRTDALVVFDRKDAGSHGTHDARPRPLCGVWLPRTRAERRFR